MKENRLTVLLVDDDKSILRTFTRILQRAGYETDTATSGKEALGKLQVRSYDIALIDLFLGDSNGLDLLTEIGRNSPRTFKIMITGADIWERRDEAHNNGADVYLTKPINPADLLDILKKR